MDVGAGSGVKKDIVSALDLDLVLDVPALAPLTAQSLELPCSV